MRAYPTTDLSALPSRAASAVRPHIAIVVGIVLFAATAGFASGRAHAADLAGFESALVVLLRFMAACKAAAALGAAALLVWRSRRPIGDMAFATYGGGLALMAAAPGMIWSLGLIAPGALLFHAGLLVFAVTAARDDAVASPFPRRRG